MTSLLTLCLLVVVAIAQAKTRSVGIKIRSVGIEAGAHVGNINGGTVIGVSCSGSGCEDMLNLDHDVEAIGIEAGASVGSINNVVVMGACFGDGCPKAARTTTIPAEPKWDCDNAYVRVSQVGSNQAYRARGCVIRASPGMTIRGEGCMVVCNDCVVEGRDMTVLGTRATLSGQDGEAYGHDFTLSGSNLKGQGVFTKVSGRNIKVAGLCEETSGRNIFCSQSLGDCRVDDEEWIFARWAQRHHVKYNRDPRGDETYFVFPAK